MRILIFFIVFVWGIGANLHFDLYKKNSNQGNTLLVIGGIHGNEPGGYFSASFLVRYYHITYGNLWIVPNLNFDSIIQNRRGIYGDMNRKFAFIKKSDKDYKIVNDIKKIILNKQVDLVINLHDGHGYYRRSWENSIFNPQAWGQACIIDQEKIKADKFGNLGEMAQKVAKTINKNLKKGYHFFNVKNTKTKFKDEQMRLSLTYFAITHSKPALAIETSKNIKDLATKVYYQLRAIEGFMKLLGIKYERDFTLSIPEIRKLLNKEEYIVINGKSIIPLNAKKRIGFFPLSKKLSYKSPNPLVVIVKRKNVYDVYEGNRKITTLFIQRFKSGCKLDKITLITDGKTKSVELPSVVGFKSSFKILTDKYRVNVIGFASKSNEANKVIKYLDLDKKFAIDKNNRLFRVEIYKEDKYCGMILLRKEDENSISKLEQGKN